LQLLGPAKLNRCIPLPDFITEIGLKLLNNGRPLLIGSSGLRGFHNFPRFVMTAIAVWRILGLAAPAFWNFTSSHGKMPLPLIADAVQV